MANKVSTNGIVINVGMNLNTEKANADFMKVMGKFQEKAVITAQVDIGGDRLTKAIKQYKDDMGNLITETNVFSRSWGNVQREITSIKTPLDQVNEALAQQAREAKKATAAQQNLNTTVKSGRTIFQDFTATFLKMAKFNTINMIYDGIITKMREAIQITNDFDAAMTEFKKVTDTTSLSLSEYTETLGELGEATARTTTQMLESATEFSKAGFTPEESARLAQIASLYQNIADAEISAGEAASFITSQIKAYKDYGVEANNATQIIDKLNEVSNNFAVSSSDIASALTKQSASLAAYGNDLDRSIALVTAGTEIMTGQAGKVARGLRTIGANITQLAQGAKEFEIQVHGATKTIQLWNDEGTDMLNTYDVLKQISEVWDDMTNAEKSSLAITLAKKTQMDTFLAVMGNFEDAEKAYTTALLSEGSAWKENEKYMESIEAHQAKLKQQWEKLVLSLPIEELEKALLSAGTALLKFVNSDVGQAVVKFTAFLAVLQLLNVAFAHLNAAMLSAPMGSVLASIRMLIAGTGTLTGVVDALTASLLANPLFWGVAAVVGIAAIVKALDVLIVSYNEQIEKLNELKQTYDEAQSEIESVENKLKELAQLQSEIEEKKIEITDPEQLSELKQQSDELERQKATLERQLILAKQKADEAEREAKAVAESALIKKTKVQVQTTGVGHFEWHGTAPEVFSKEINEMKRLQAQIIENNKTLEKLKEHESDNAKEIDNLTKKNNALVEQFNKMESEAAKTAEELGNVSDVLGDMSVNVGDHNELLSSLLNSFANFVGWSREATDKTVELTDATEDETEAVENEADAAEEASNAWDEFLDNIEGVQSAYETLTKAADEYNENGFITASTLKKLNKLSPEYLAILAQEGDTYENINTTLGEYLEKEKEQALQKVNLARYTAILELCEKTLKEQTEKTSDVVEESGDKASDAADDYDKLGNAAIKAAIGMKAVEDGGLNTDEFYEKFNEINNYFDGLENAIKETNLGATKSSKSAAGSHKDAWVQAFEEEKDALKNLLETDQITEYEYYQRLNELNEKYFGEISGRHEKYIKEYRENEEEIYKGMKEVYDKVKDYLKEAIEEGYEKAINAIKKEEKKVLAEIKNQIDALKKERETIIKGIEKEIKALKKEKEAVEKYYNDQIDAIKRENEVLEQQNELLEKQQELQKAKEQKVMVMQNGRFQLTENESAVAQAEQNLSNYEDQLSYEQQIQELEDLRDAQVQTIEERIEALEEYKEYIEEYYDEQIEALEEYYDRVEEQYEAQIEALQEELDAFKEGYQKSEDLDNARLAAEVLAANEEASIWQQRLENLASAITEYNRLMELMGEGGAASSGFSAGLASYNKISQVGEVDNVISRASGDKSFANDEVALVGESPNAELVLGSKLNHSVNSGKLIHLTKGSGVVNAESTQTLAGLLNGLENPTNVANNRSTQQNFSFGTINLPNVTDADSFVNTLSRKFNNYAIQYGNTRK